ncbi:MAG: hypothetical protein ACOYOP_12845 [Microthrixaceae bacterium]
MHLLLGDRELDLTDRAVVLDGDAAVERVVTDDVAAVVRALDGGAPTVWWSAPGVTDPGWCTAAASALEVAGCDPARVVLDDRLDLLSVDALSARCTPRPPPPGPALAAVLPDDLDEPALVASLVIAFAAGRRVVRCGDPVTARRCLDVWEVLERERTERFEHTGAPGERGR